jgi:hypothetical protein
MPSIRVPAASVGNYMTVAVRYEELTPGPAGERFAVIDYDGGNKTFYKPVDLDNPKLLIPGGLPLIESDPRFHQQMVYAVACETLQRFEYALGRRIRWRGTTRGAGRRLNLYPHAMCEANAFYSREAHGILFGYFKAGRTQQGRYLPGQTVYTCLSHDIIAHEVTHAIVDSIREYFMEPMVLATGRDSVKRRRRSAPKRCARSHAPSRRSGMRSSTAPAQVSHSRSR